MFATLLHFAPSKCSISFCQSCFQLWRERCPFGSTEYRRSNEISYTSFHVGDMFSRLPGSFFLKMTSADSVSTYRCSGREVIAGREVLDVLNRGYIGRLHNSDSFRKCGEIRRIQERNKSRDRLKCKVLLYGSGTRYNRKYTRSKIQHYKSLNSGSRFNWISRN